MNKTLAAIAAATFLACILLANYVTTEYGMVPVGFGLVATAGTYLAGLTFLLRDTVQDAAKSLIPPRREIRTVEEEVYPGMPRPLAGLMRTVRREVEVPRSDWFAALPVVGLIILGAVLSFAISDPFIALASGVAFLASELADLAIYTPLRKRGYIRAAVASNVVGAFVDTVLFLWIAGFPILAALPGQMVGKVAVTALVVALVAAFRVRRAVAA